MSKRPSDIDGNDLYDFDLFGPGSSSFEGWTVHGDGLKDFEFEDENGGRYISFSNKEECDHEWQEYIGFNSRDYFCTKCNEKRDTI